MDNSQELFVVEILFPDGWRPVSYKARPLREAQILFSHFISNWHNNFYRLTKLEELN